MSSDAEANRPSSALPLVSPSPHSIPQRPPHNRDTESPRVWPSPDTHSRSKADLGWGPPRNRGWLGPGDGCHLGLQVIALLLVQTAVHHMHNIIDCDRRLCDIGGQHNLAHPNWRLLEYGLLVHHGDVGVHWWAARTCWLWAQLLLPVMRPQDNNFDPILMELRPRSRLHMPTQGGKASRSRAG